MAYVFDVDDVAFLRSAEGGETVDRLARQPLTADSRMADVALARRLAGTRFAAAVLETAVLRRRAESKVDFAASGLFTEEALQQATAGVVARHRARRLVGRDVHDATCSIGADLHETVRFARRCVGSDLDEVRLRMARHNLETAGNAVLVRADALRPVTRDAIAFVDPARRSGGKRRWNPEDLVPPLPAVLDAYAGRDAVLKCAPGMDFDAVPADSEIELVSLAGGVREASVWLGDLAGAGVRRRASVLRDDQAQWTTPGAETITDAEPDDCPVREVGQWLVDPDGAVVRAGLVRQYAARHGLGQLDPRIAYLTGDAPPPGTRAFRVLEHGRYREKSLRQRLREHDIGRLEILVRGLDIDPDALRRKLKLSGNEQATVVLTRVGDTPTAYLCRAERF